MNKSINRRELARLVSQETGYSITDVEAVLKSEDEVIAQAISQGVEVKKHKLFKLEIETKKAKNAWDGFNKRHYHIEEKQVVKFKPLSMITEAINKLNEEQD